MHLIRKSHIWIARFLAVCMLFCSACGTKKKEDFSYVRSSFSLAVKGHICLLSQKNQEDVTQKPSFSGVTRENEPLAFSASVTFIPSATEDPTHISGRLSITYTAPEALSGMTLTCHFLTPEDLYGSDLPVTVTYPATSENMTVTLPSSSMAGLLSPGAVLFPLGDVTYVSPLRDGTKTVTIQKNPLSSEIFPSTIIYTLSDGELFPLSVRSENEKIQLLMEICG